MPESRYVSADRLLRILVYVAVALVALLVGNAVLSATGAASELRRGLVLAWIVLFPLGGWLVWRRSGSRDAH